MTKELGNDISGQWLGSEKFFEKRSPFDGSLMAKVHEANAEMDDKAVARGRKVSTGAHSGEWRAMPLKPLLAIIHDFANRLLARIADLVETDVEDTGRNYWQATTFDDAHAARLLHAYADIAFTLENRLMQFSGEPGFQGTWYTTRRPKDVNTCICFFKVQLIIVSIKIAPALVMDNAAILKPSEETPSSATILAEVIAESDIPDGVFSLLHGFGSGSTGGFLTVHPKIDTITFTGERGKGSTIMKAAADGLREVSLEFGGKNAALVFEDAEMDRVAEGMTRSSFFNCGQICFCTELAYVHRRRFDEFVERMADIANGIVIGDKAHNDFNIRPLVSHAHRDKVMELLDTVPEHGDEFVTGGGIPDIGDERDNGAIIQPSAAIGSPEDFPFVKQEAFGPVLHVAAFDDEEEAIALANDTDYGLATCIWTEILNRAHRVTSRIRVSHAWINAWQIRDLLSPLAGAEASGVGDQGGRLSLEFSSLPQTVTMRIFGNDQ